MDPKAFLLQQFNATAQERVSSSLPKGNLYNVFEITSPYRLSFSPFDITIYKSREAYCIGSFENKTYKDGWYVDTFHQNHEISIVTHLTLSSVSMFNFLGTILLLLYLCLLTAEQNIYLLDHFFYMDVFVLCL